MVYDMAVYECLALVFLIYKISLIFNYHIQCDKIISQCPYHINHA